MAKLFLTNINLNGNQLQNAVIQKLASAPTSPTPVSGQVYFNTGDNFIYVYNGTSWDKLLESGSVVNADISATAAIAATKVSGTAVTRADTGSVTSTMILDGTILNADINATAAIDKTKIAGTAVTLADTGTITSTMIADGTIVNGDIAAGAAIDLSKLAVNPINRANHTGTQLASTISDLATTVQGYRLDQFAVPTSSLNINSQRITNVATPSADGDAANKGYVDATRQGLDVKDSVRVATTANITLSGTQTIDSVAVIAGDRVLVKDQTTQTANGIYVVAAGGWTRSTDADTGAKLSGGSFVFVEQGNANADSGWVMTADGTIVLGTTNITWAQFSGAGQIDAGAGLTKTGNTLNVATASTARIVVNANDIDLATVANPQTGASVGTVFVQSIATDSYGRVTTVTNGTRKFTAQNPLLTVSSGSANWSIVHNLGVADYILQVRQVSNNELVEADVFLTNAGTATVTIASTAGSIAADTYRVVILP
jgi:phage-related tail fiber protein